MNPNALALLACILGMIGALLVGLHIGARVSGRKPVNPEHEDCDLDGEIALDAGFEHLLFLSRAFGDEELLAMVIYAHALWLRGGSAAGARALQELLGEEPRAASGVAR